MKNFFMYLLGFVLFSSFCKTSPAALSPDLLVSEEVKTRSTNISQAKPTATLFVDRSELKTQASSINNRLESGVVVSISALRKALDCIRYDDENMLIESIEIIAAKFEQYLRNLSNTLNGCFDDEEMYQEAIGNFQKLFDELKEANDQVGVYYMWLLLNRVCNPY